MLHKLSKFILLLAFIATPAAARVRFWNYCQQGGTTVSTASIISATKVQASYPGCTVSVYITGSSPATLATLYADNTGTPKANPFTADNVTGYYFYYADNGTYDDQLSGTGFTTFTRAANSGIDPFSVPNVVSYSPRNGSFSSQCTAATTQNLTLVVTVPVTGLTTQTMTCSVIYWKNGSIQANSGQTITMNPSFYCFDYTQCFVGPGAFLFTGAAPPLNPNWFGADWTGTADSLAAFNAAYAAGNVLSVIAGTYNLSAQFAMNRDATVLSCPNSTSRLSYTGTSNITSIVQVTGNNGLRIEGCGFIGNIHVTKALVYLNTVAGDIVRDVKGFSVTATSGTGPQSFVYAFGGNTNTLENVTTTGGQYLNQGIVLEDETDSLVIRPKMEQVVNEGIKIFHGAGLSCSKNTILGGTSEGVGTGLSIPSCTGNTIIGLDMENNSVADIVDGSSVNHYSDVLGAIHFTSTSVNGIVDGSGLNGVTVDAGAYGNSFTNNFYEDITPTDNGTCTQFLHNLNTNGSKYYPDQLGCQNGVTYSGAFNRVVETAGSANNALVGSFSAPSYQSPVAVPCPAALDNSNDGMLVNIQLTHSLRATLSNTFTFCGFGPYPIVANGTGGLTNLPAAMGVDDVIILRWEYSSSGGQQYWVKVSQ